MPVFAYKAADGGGRVVRGSLESPDERSVAGKLQEMGYIPIRIRETGGNAASVSGRILRLDVSGLFRAAFLRVSTKDVQRFTQDLAALLEAGVPVDRALSILIDTTENPRFRRTIEEILKSVQGGSYLSDALARYPRIFSEFYVNMVRAGEAGGVLEAVLVRLGDFLESATELKDYITSALVYPLFLVCVGGISIIILMTFVIPKFSIIFSDMGGTIPLSTQVLLALSDGIRRYWWAILAAAAGMVLGYRQYARTESGRRRIDRWKLAPPVGGDLVRNIEMARFSRTLGTLTQSGVPILQALRLVKGIISNRIIAGAVGNLHDRVKEGDRLSQSLREGDLFPSLAVQMIMVGEESGKLDEMLLRVAENYEKVVRNTIKRLISFLEPAMILVMGLIVGFIVISMLMAIFSINEMPF